MFSRAARRKAGNFVFIGLCIFATVVALIALGFILWSLFSQGIGGMNLQIFTMDTPAPDSEGGLRNAIYGSIMMCGFGMLIAPRGRRSRRHLAGRDRRRHALRPTPSASSTTSFCRRRRS
ncbi:MAG: hypothetical protein WDN06_13795 [Asticcacaulis sp.]